MLLVVGLFDSYDNAKRVVKKMREEGFSDLPISIVAPDWSIEPEETWGISIPYRGKKKALTIDSGHIEMGKGSFSVDGVEPVSVLDDNTNGFFTTSSGPILGGLITLGVDPERAQDLKEGVLHGNVLLVIENLTYEKIDRVKEILTKEEVKDIYVQ